MPNAYKNKVVYNGTTLIDLTADTVTPAALMQGYTAHDASGAAIVGTATGGSVSQDAQGYIVLPETDDGGGSSDALTLKMGVLRPDAELVQSWSYDKLLVEDEGKTIGTYSTNKVTYISTSNLEPTITINFDDYDYFVAIRTLSMPIYSTDTIGDGRAAFACQSYTYEWVVVPYDNTLAMNNAITSCANYFYYDSSLTLKQTASSCGACVTTYTPTRSSSVLTIKSPSLALQGNATYFNQTYWAYMTDVRYQYIIEVWRTPRNNLNINGNTHGSLHEHIFACASNASGTLT